MSNELETSRYDQLMRRVGSMVGPGSRVAEVLTELFPVIDVERVPGELLALMGTRLGVGTSALLAGGGIAPKIQVFNPAESGNIITVTQFIAVVDTAQEIRWAVTGTALSTAIGLQAFRDGRFRLPARPLGQIRRESSATLTLAEGEIDLEAATIFTLADPNGVAILSPGTGFEVGATTFATKLRVTFNWRERPAEPSELQL